MWILISWLHQKPADLDLHCFGVVVFTQMSKSYAYSALIKSNTVYKNKYIEKK